MKRQLEHLRNEIEGMAVQLADEVPSDVEDVDKDFDDESNRWFAREFYAVKHETTLINRMRDDRKQKNGVVKLHRSGLWLNQKYRPIFFSVEIDASCCESTDLESFKPAYLFAAWRFGAWACGIVHEAWPPAVGAPFNLGSTWAGSLFSPAKKYEQVQIWKNTSAPMLIDFLPAGLGNLYKKQG